MRFEHGFTKVPSWVFQVGTSNLSTHDSWTVRPSQTGHSEVAISLYLNENSPRTTPIISVVSIFLFLFDTFQ